MWAEGTRTISTNATGRCVTRCCHFCGVANSSASLVAGCVPYTKLLQHDVEEEEKVLHLCHHSKKSAIEVLIICLSFVFLIVTI